MLSSQWYEVTWTLENLTWKFNFGRVRPSRTVVSRLRSVGFGRWQRQRQENNASLISQHLSPATQNEEACPCSASVLLLLLNNDVVSAIAGNSLSRTHKLSPNLTPPLITRASSRPGSVLLQLQSSWERQFSSLLLSSFVCAARSSRPFHIDVKENFVRLTCADCRAGAAARLKIVLR